MRWNSAALVSATLVGVAVGVGVEPANAAAGISTAVALQAALDSGARIIRLAPLARIRLTAGLTHTGSGNVTISGKRATLDARFAGTDAIVFSGGGNVTLEDMSILNGPTRGVVVAVPSGKTGVVTLRLRNVTVQRFGAHGVHVDDTSGSGGSPASVQVDFRDVQLLNNGDARGVDADALRVDESGPGSVFARLLRVTAEGNKRDGISLNEADDGSVLCNAYRCNFLRNGTLGATVSPESLVAQDSAFAGAGDGVHVTESGTGNVSVQLRNSVAKSNFGNGVDASESGDGDCTVVLGNMHISVCRGDGINVSESGNGSLTTNLLYVSSDDNLGDGLNASEADAGDLSVNHTVGSLNDNHGNGADLSQTGAGTGLARFRRMKITRNRSGNVSATGVTVIR